MKINLINKFIERIVKKQVEDINSRNIKLSSELKALKIDIDLYIQELNNKPNISQLEETNKNLGQLAEGLGLVLKRLDNLTETQDKHEQVLKVLVKKI